MKKTIRLLRHERGMTQLALAKAAGVDERSVIRWESGSHCPMAHKRHAVAAALGVSPDDVDWGDGDAADAAA